MSTGSSGEKRARSRNFNEMEKESFIDICHEFVEVIENKVINAMTNKQKCEAWEKIAQRYNILQTTGYRNPIQLKSLYEQLKKNVRKNKAESASDKSKSTVNIEQKLRALIPVQLQTLPVIEVKPAIPENNLPIDHPNKEYVNLNDNMDNKKRKRPDETSDIKLEILHVILEAEKENLRGKRLENEIKEIELKIKQRELNSLK